MVDQFPGDTFGGCGNWQSGRPLVPRPRRFAIMVHPSRGGTGDLRVTRGTGEAAVRSPAWCCEGNERLRSHAAGRDEGTHLGEAGDMATVAYHWENSDVLVLTISGEVDTRNVDLLRERLATILQPGTRNVVFDLGGLEFIDSSGLAVLVDVANHVGGAKLRAPSRLVWRVVDVTGLGELLPTEQ